MQHCDGTIAQNTKNKITFCEQSLKMLLFLARDAWKMKNSAALLYKNKKLNFDISAPPEGPKNQCVPPPNLTQTNISTLDHLIMTK